MLFRSDKRSLPRVKKFSPVSLRKERKDTGPGKELSREAQPLKGHPRKARQLEMTERYRAGCSNISKLGSKEPIFDMMACKWRVERSVLRDENQPVSGPVGDHPRVRISRTSLQEEALGLQGLKPV